MWQPAVKMDNMKIKTLKDSDLLYADIENRIDSIKAKKNLYTLFFRFAKVAIFVGGGLITVFTGWKNGDLSSPDLRNAVLIISASISLLAALEGLFALREKGRSYDILLFDLRRLRDRMCYDFIQSPQHYAQQRDGHFKKYQEILESQKAIIALADGSEE
jgi:hypothetical protein